MERKGLDAEPFRPGIVQIEHGVNFVKHTRGQEQVACSSEQLQGMSLIKMYDGSGITDDGSHLAA